MFDTGCAAGNREHIPNYKGNISGQKRDPIQRNQKGPIPGRAMWWGWICFDEPKAPDLVLQNDGERTLELGRGDRGGVYPNIVEHPHRQYRLLEPVLSKQALPHQPLPSPGMCPTPVEPATLAELVRQRAGPSTLLSGAGTVAMDLVLRRPSACPQQPVPHARFMRRLRQPHPPPAGEL